MAALTTAIQMSAERSGAAVLDGEQDTKVEPRQPGAVPFDETVAVRANDLCHLERWPQQMRAYSFRDPRSLRRFQARLPQNFGRDGLVGAGAVDRSGEQIG